MLLTILKIVAGLAVLGIVAMVMVAVLSGLVSSFRALRHRTEKDDDVAVGSRPRGEIEQDRD